MAELKYKPDGTLDIAGQNAVAPVATQNANVATIGKTAIAPVKTGLIGSSSTSGGTTTVPPATGIGETSSSPPSETAAPATPGPATWNVDDNQTVAGNVAKIIAQGSPLNDLAETRSNQEMNRRGLINSSMAVGAGQKALYESALPMAQQDAQTHAAAAQFNTGQTNTMATQQAELDQQANLANAQAKNQIEMFNSEQFLKAKLADADQYSKVVMQNADTQTKVYLGELQANYQTLMQTDASVAGVFSTAMKNMADIMVTDQLTLEGKTTAINNIKTMLTDSLAMQQAVSGLDLLPYLV